MYTMYNKYLERNMNSYRIHISKDNRYKTLDNNIILYYNCIYKIKR